jgi:hypothetical protein
LDVVTDIVREPTGVALAAADAVAPDTDGAPEPEAAAVAQAV